MADIAALKSKYFVQPGDDSPPSQPVPETFEGSWVMPLIDGEAYFSELRAALTTVGTGATEEENAEHFIFVAGWWLNLLGGTVGPAPGASGSGIPALVAGTPFSLDGPGGTDVLIDLLKIKSQAGVDVRVLGWIPWSVMARGITRKRVSGFRDMAVLTMSSIDDLRSEPTLAKKCCLNIIGHAAGSAHTKLVILGTDTRALGFTGSADFVNDRHADQTHTIDPTYGTGWRHEVTAKVEGPAVQGLYDFFKDMWNEVVSQPVKSYRAGTKNVPSVVSGTSVLPAKALNTANVGTHHVQNLRTVHQANYGKIPDLLPEGPLVSFAPNGLFEVRIAWRKAILAAEKYIYMEDWAFWSIEIMDWIAQAISAQPDLRVILVRGDVDPTDPPFPPYFNAALQDGLVAGLTTAQLDRVGVFRREGVHVHAKTTLIDDHWAIIGSANCNRRGLYTDLEHSVSVLDEDDQMVRQYRINLWGDHFGLPLSERSVLNDLSKALNVWNFAWGVPGSGVTLPSYLTKLLLPPPPKTLSKQLRRKYDLYWDPDSRQNWSGCP